MPDKMSVPSHGRRTLIFALPAVVIYVIMIQITLAHLVETTGMVPFDMRPLGYSWEQAQALLQALGAGGRHYYLTRQIPLDMLYPGLMAATLIYLLLWLGAGRVLRIGIALSMAAALADYSENAGIVRLLMAGPAVSPGMVMLTSAASIIKAGLTTLAVSLVLIVGLYRGFTLVCRNWARRSGRDPQV